MSSEEKRAYLLLKSVIFQYHGLDEAEQENLDASAKEIDGVEELAWANSFISEDYITAFDRARDYLKNIFMSFDKEKRLDYLDKVWQSNNSKGFITEMEATAILRLARDWEVESDLIELVKSKSSK